MSENNPAKPLVCAQCGTPVDTASAQYCRACGAQLTATPVPRPSQPVPDLIDPMLGREVLGRYKILSVIGHGGMGTVYLAEQHVGDTTRRVAVKVLSGAYARDPTLATRFKREAGIIANLNSPNTVRLLDFDAQDGQLFIVMEYVEGTRLAEVLDRGPVSPAQAVSILVQVARSLDEAHRMGVVHRDLKPENIMVREPEGSALHVTVLDFGVAQRIEPGSEKNLTGHGMLIGTPAYMSPEQILGLSLGPQSDVYALGLIAWHMLAGKHPFTAKTVQEWARQHSTVDPPALKDRVPGLPSRIYRAIDHALAKSFEDRTQSAAEFVRELTGLSPDADVWSAAIARMRSERPSSQERITITAPGRTTAVSSEPPQVPGLEPRRGWVRVMAVLAVIAALVGAGVVLMNSAEGPGGRAANRDAGGMDATAHALTELDAAREDVVDVAPARDVVDVVLSTAARAAGWIALASGALEARNVHEAVEALVGLRALNLDGRNAVVARSLRNELAALGARLVREHIALGACDDARSVFTELKRVSAESAASKAFTRECTRP